jgi:hypothetical protein
MRTGVVSRTEAYLSGFVSGFVFSCMLLAVHVLLMHSVIYWVLWLLLLIFSCVLGFFGYRDAKIADTTEYTEKW